MKDLEAFREEIQSAASGYSYDNEQLDFTAVVRISVVDGWTSAEVVEYIETSAETDEYDESDE